MKQVALCAQFFLEMRTGDERNGTTGSKELVGRRGGWLLQPKQLTESCLRYSERKTRNIASFASRCF